MSLGSQLEVVLDKTVGVGAEGGISDEEISAMVEEGATSEETKDVSIGAISEETKDVSIGAVSEETKDVSIGAVSDEATVTKELRMELRTSDDTAKEMVEIPEGVPGRVLIISEENSLDRVIGALELAASVMVDEA